MNQEQIQIQTLRNKLFYNNISILCIWAYVAYKYGTADAFSLGTVMFCVDILEYVLKSM